MIVLSLRGKALRGGLPFLSSPASIVFSLFSKDLVRGRPKSFGRVRAFFAPTSPLSFDEDASTSSAKLALLLRFCEPAGTATTASTSGSESESDDDDEEEDDDEESESEEDIIRFS